MGQETPGLRSRKRKGGADALYWCATAEAVKAGFTPRTVNLTRHKDNPILLSAACRKLDAEQRQWLAGKVRDRSEYTGTFSSLFRRYETHPDSPFRTLKPSSKRAYIGYLTMLDEAIGKRRITAVTGLDVKGWHKIWKAAPPGQPERLAAAAFPKATAPCPALRFAGSNFRCAIVEAEAAAGMEPVIADALGIGRGCCSDDPEPSHGR